jgi:hypothetical protein
MKIAMKAAAYMDSGMHMFPGEGLTGGVFDD